MKIATREELINALMDGAELEHNLACMYLFASYSIKTQPEELVGVPADQQSTVLNTYLKNWNQKLRAIAMQEMGHLGTVCNILTLLGAEAHFDRPNFPPADGYYPPSAKITLERFGKTALQRFVEFERNASSPGVAAFGIAPRNVTYRHVGELYEAIYEAFQEIADGGISIPNPDLFLGYTKAMDSEWPGSIVEVHDFGLGDQPPVAIDELRGKVREALQDVIEEGEGSKTVSPESHYQVLFQMAQDLTSLLTLFPGLDPARPVPDNPMTQRHRGAGSNINLITAQPAKDIAELVNSFYGTMLIALRQTYAFSENLGDGARRGTMHEIAGKLMKRCIGPLGAELPTLSIANGTQVAGPGFELYRPVYVSDKPQIAWNVVSERLRIASDECARLVGLGTLPAKVLTAINFAKTTSDALRTKANQLAQ